jgi:hypothetical protein
MARAAAAEATLQGVFFLQPLASDSATLLIECAVSDGRFEVRSGVDDAALADAATHCSGSIEVGSWQRVHHVSVRARSSADAAHVCALYASFDAGGLQYGPAYRTIVQAWAGDGDAQARLRARVASEGTAVHPAGLDDALCVGALISRSSRGEANVQTRLPYALDNVLLQGAQYDMFHTVGLQYGPSYRQLQQAWACEQWRGDGVWCGAVARLRRRLGLQAVVVHPADLDGSIQLGQFSGRSEVAGKMLLPFALDAALLEGGAVEQWAVRAHALAPTRAYIC